jgi:hypothetical protein
VVVHWGDGERSSGHPVRHLFHWRNAVLEDERPQHPDLVRRHSDKCQPDAIGPLVNDPKRYRDCNLYPFAVDDQLTEEIIADPAKIRRISDGDAAKRPV